MSKSKIDSARNYQPFRYPGGKTKLAANPAFRQLLDSLIGSHTTFYEGFLGSAAVTLDVALRYPTLKFEAVDADYHISGFWQLIGGGTDQDEYELLDKLAVIPTVEIFKRLRGLPPVTLAERAYHAIFFNRTTFSGIAMSQPIGGFNQTSQWKINCRYNPTKLQDKVRKLRKLFRGRLNMTHGDALGWLGTIPAGVPLYLDAPYFIKGDVLYPVKMNELQHAALADVLVTKTNWIMSYDVCPEITTLYEFAQLLRVPFRYSINGKKTDWKQTNEYLICSPEIDTAKFDEVITTAGNAAPACRAR